MDAKKLGQFIAQLRKEQNMTQADLARKLQVTDKAVSKWERGQGLPDINTIEPLADALGVSVLEIMKSEFIPTDTISQENAAAVITDTFDMVKQQRKQERKHLILIFIGALISIALFFLWDIMGWMGMIGVVAPCLCFSFSVSLIIYGIHRIHRKLPCAYTFILAALFASYPVFLFLMFFLIGVFGLGPVPT